jgi:uncharacterized protein (DUF736 family)
MQPHQVTVRPLKKAYHIDKPDAAPVATATAAVARYSYLSVKLDDPSFPPLSTQS